MMIKKSQISRKYLNEILGYDKYLDVEKPNILLCVDINKDSVYVIDAWDNCTVTMFTDNNIKDKLKRVM